MSYLKQWIGKRTSSFFYWYRAYSFVHRASMVFEWLENPKNARIWKWVIRGSALGVVAIVGFLARGVIEVIIEQNDGLIAALTHIAGNMVPRFFHPYLTDTTSFVGFLALEVLLFFMLATFVWIIYMAIKNSRIVGFVDHGLRRATHEVQQRLALEGENEEDYFSVAGAIEIGRHPFICADPSLSGWDVSSMGEAQIIIEHDMGANAIYDDSLTANIANPTGHNGKKYSLIATPVDYLDASPRLSLQVRSTSYYQVKKFQELIKDPEVKGRLVSIHPEKHQVPNSLCLHYIVQLADGNILCSVRNANTDYSQGELSLSGEEQLCEDDMNAGVASVAAHWFRRALCEEVFPLRVDPEGGLQAAWEKVEDFVTSMRIFSLIYEEYCANYALVGFARLNLDLHWFKVKYGGLRQKNLAGRDKEGTFFVVPKSELLSYLQNGECQIYSVWGDRIVRVSEQPNSVQLHPTSRYRGLMILLSTGALNERSLKHPSRTAFDYSMNSILNDKIARLEQQLNSRSKGDCGEGGAQQVTMVQSQ